MYSVSLVCVVMYWKIGQFYKDSETAGYKGIYYYIIFFFPPDTNLPVENKKKRIKCKIF